MISQAALELAQKVIEIASEKKVRLCFAESCTGGLVTGCLTDIAGSSEVLEGGIVTYSNEAKQDLLAVDPETLSAHGAVSAETAEAMATGAFAAFGRRATISLSVTGIAGPDGATQDKPVGLVWFGLAEKGEVRSEWRTFSPVSRRVVRERAVETALQIVLGALARI